jgi:hypothetical protein
MTLQESRARRRRVEQDRLIARRFNLLISAMIVLSVALAFIVN